MQEITGQNKFNWWRRDLLLISSAIPALANSVSNILAAKYLGLAVFGTFMVWRTACMLTISINPGFGAALTILIPGSDAVQKKFLNFSADLSTLIWGAFWVVLGAILFYYYGNLPENVILPLALYWVGLYYAGHTTSVARGYKNGRALFYGGLADSVGSVLSIAAAFYHSLPIFLWAQALRFVFKSVAQYTLPGMDVDWKKKFVEGQKILISTGIPMMFRGWVQTASQYGDRFLVGVVFGSLVAGVTSLGSTLALPAAMLSSTASAYILPLLIENSEKKDKANIMMREINTSLLTILGCGLVMPSLIWVVPDVTFKLPLASAGFWLVATYSILQLAVTDLIAHGKIWYATAWSGASIITVFLLIYVANLFHINPFVILSVCSIIISFWSAFLLYRIPALAEKKKLVALGFVVWVMIIIVHLIIMNYIPSLKWLQYLMAASGSLLLIYVLTRIIHRK